MAPNTDILALANVFVQKRSLLDAASKFCTLAATYQMRAMWCKVKLVLERERITKRGDLKAL